MDLCPGATRGGRGVEAGDAEGVDEGVEEGVAVQAEEAVGDGAAADVVEEVLARAEGDGDAVGEDLEEEFVGEGEEGC